MIIGQNALLNQYVPTFYIKNISEGQILIYDSTRKAFINADNIGGSGGAIKLGELLDVNPSVDNPLSLHNGQALIYNSFSNLWENQFTDYNTLLNKPVIPTNSSFSFAALSDTAKPSLPNGYVKWDSTGTQLVYSTTIPASSITGLATVATTGNYNDLTNKPIIPPATSAPLDQVVYGTGPGVTSSNTLTYDSSINTLTVGASGPALITSDPGQSMRISGDTSVTLTTSTLDRLTINAGGAFAVGGNTGTSGQVLTSQGNSGVPIWATTITVSAPLDQIVYGTGSGVASSSGLTYNSSTDTLTVGLTGPALISTGAGQPLDISADSITLTTATIDRVIINNTGSISINGTPGTAGQVLTSHGSGSTPTWSTLANSLGSLSNVSPTADTLNNSTDIGKTLSWNGTIWIPANPQMRVVATLSARDALVPSLGNQAYVVNSDDGQGDYVNMWSLWIYTIAGPSNGWTLLSRQESGTGVQSATIEYSLTHLSPGVNIVGILPTGGRITLITVEVTTPFDGAPTLDIGYIVENPSSPPPVPSGLMAASEIDLTVAGTYSAASDILFGIDTLPGDIEVTATFVPNGSTIGAAQIIVSYV